MTSSLKVFTDCSIFWIVELICPVCILPVSCILSLASLLDIPVEFMIARQPITIAVKREHAKIPVISFIFIVFMGSPPFYS